MNTILKTALVACVVVAASATSSFATPASGTTLAGGNNGANAKRQATMSKHGKMMHRKSMMKSHKAM